VLRDELPAGADVSAVAWAGVLGLLALALVVVGLAGRRSGGIGALAAIAFVVALVNSQSGGGEGFFEDSVEWSPTSIESDDSAYQLATGSAVLDLTELDLTDADPTSLGTAPSGARVPEVSADVSVGELRVLVPDDLNVELDATVGIGDLTGSREGGAKVGPGGRTELLLDLNVGIGSMIIEEVSR
jgi:hypothetical protein